MVAAVEAKSVSIVVPVPPKLAALKVPMPPLNVKPPLTLTLTDAVLRRIGISQLQHARADRRRAGVRIRGIEYHWSRRQSCSMELLRQPTPRRQCRPAFQNVPELVSVAAPIRLPPPVTVTVPTEALVDNVHEPAPLLVNALPEPIPNAPEIIPAPLAAPVSVRLCVPVILAVRVCDVPPVVDASSVAAPSRLIVRFEVLLAVLVNWSVVPMARSIVVLAALGAPNEQLAPALASDVMLNVPFNTLVLPV